MSRLGRRWLGVAVILAVMPGCVGMRSGSLSSHDDVPRASVRAVDLAVPSVDYRTHFIGRLPGGAGAFADRVARMLARHPVLATATPDVETASLHLDFTLTNTTNRLVAVLTGLACGLTFTLIPGYARDDFILVVELRDGAVVKRRLEYRDAVTTVVHAAAVFTPRESQPRYVVENVVDDILQHALRDLDAGGVGVVSVPPAGDVVVPRPQ